MLKRLLIKNIVYTAYILILLVISFIASIYLIVNEPKLSVNERNMIGTMPVQISLIAFALHRLLISLFDLLNKYKTIFVTVRVQSFVDYSVIEKDDSAKTLYCYDLDGKLYKCHVYDDIYEANFHKNQMYTIEILKYTHIIVSSHLGKANDEENEISKARTVFRKKIIKYKSKIRKNYLSKFDFVFNHKVLIFTILFALVILCPIIVGLLEWPIIISKIVGYSIIGFICLFYMACVFY